MKKRKKSNGSKRIKGRVDFLKRKKTEKKKEGKKERRGEKLVL